MKSSSSFSQVLHFFDIKASSPTLCVIPQPFYSIHLIKAILMFNEVFAEMTSGPDVFEKRIISEMCAGEAEARRGIRRTANIYVRNIFLYL